MRGIRRKFRITLASAISASLVHAPVASRAATNPDRQRQAVIEDFLKTTGLGSAKRPTVGEFYDKVRAGFPSNARPFLDLWVMIHQKELMPKIEVQKLKDADDNVQYKFFLKGDKGETVTISTGEGYVKIGGVRFDSKEAADIPGFLSKLTRQDNYFKTMAKKAKPADLTSVSLAMTAAQYKKLSAEQRAHYHIRLRLALEDGMAILQPEDVKSAALRGGLEVVMNWLAGEPAFAVKVGGPCLISGYIDVYGSNTRCAGAQRTPEFVREVTARTEATFKTKVTCSGSGSYPCNPMVYGFNNNGGTFCVGGDLTNATLGCNKQSELAPKGDPKRAKDIQRIIQSWVKAQGGKEQLEFSADGKIRDDQYHLVAGQLNALNDYVHEAINQCDSAAGKKLQAERPDQKSACDAIKTRLVELAQFNRPPPRPPVPVCDAEMAGSKWNGSKCVCEAPKREENGICQIPIQPPTVIEAEPDDEPVDRPKKEKKEDECGLWCSGWLWGGLAVVVGVGLFAWWMTRDDKPKVQTPPTIPPVAPPGDLPPTNPPPTDDPPTVPVKPTEGGTGTPPINSGGTR